MMHIKKYHVYAFDIMNKVKQKNIDDSIVLVQITDIRRRVFGKTLYYGIDTASGATIRCTKDLLTPIPDSNISVITRLPVSWPKITVNDIEILSDILESIKDKKLYSEIEALKTKLEFYYAADMVKMAEDDLNENDI